MGRHRLSTGADDRHADLRQIGRSIRPQDRAAVGDRVVPAWFGVVRAQSEHDAAHSLPRRTGAGRRWARRHYAGRGRRHCSAAGSRPLSGDFWGGVRSLQYSRPADGRVLHDAPVVALDLLHQSAGRHRGAGRARRNTSIAGTTCHTRDRLRRLRFARRDVEQHHAGLRSGRDGISVVVTTHAGPDRDDGPLARIVRIRRAQSQGTRLTTAPVPAADVRHHISGWTDRGLRAVRLGDVLPAFPAGRERSESDGLGAGDDTDDGRNARHVDRVRPANQSQRTLQDFPRFRNRDDDARAFPVVATQSAE